MPNIDPDKLLELCRKRYHDGGVTLSWPTMLQIIDQLRESQAARHDHIADASNMVATEEASDGRS